MEELRVTRRLKRLIETEYNVENASDLALALANNGITEITDGIRERIYYLQQNCRNVAFDNYWFVALVVNHSLEEIMDRYLLYEKYTGNTLCDVDCLAFSCEKEAVYISLLTEYGLDHEQIVSAMKMVVELGSIAKSEEDARRILKDLNIFGIADDVRNQFISDNADLLFNDYAREANQVFECLCRKYGKDGGFACLKEHPEYIRLGVEKMSMKDQVMAYLYDDEAIFFGLRDGNYEKPDGTELLIEFAKDVCSRVKKKDAEAMNEVLFLLDIIFTLMEFAKETEWTYSLACELRNIIIS